eukprot:7994769-Pyramimonas_sp.AAC.1
MTDQSSHGLASGAYGGGLGGLQGDVRGLCEGGAGAAAGQVGQAAGGKRGGRRHGLAARELPHHDPGREVQGAGGPPSNQSRGLLVYSRIGAIGRRTHGFILTMDR